MCIYVNKFTKIVLFEHKHTHTRTKYVVTKSVLFYTTEPIFFSLML